MPKMFIFGFGYTAQFLAKKLAQLNFQITGTTRDKTKLGYHDELGSLVNCDSSIPSRHPERSEGSPNEGNVPRPEIPHCVRDDEGAGRIITVNFTEADIERELQSATHVLVSTPPSGPLGDPVLTNFMPLIKKYIPQMQWLGYLSSTGVYGDHQGGWVDESSAPINLGQQGQLRLNAENAWLSLAKQHQLPLHIFRIAGIYGPQRNALTRIASGKTDTIYKENHYFSRIHVDDIAAVLAASVLNPNPISIYNLADDEPAPSYNVDEYAASLLGVPALKRVLIEDATLSPMANEFYTHHRRVGNAKIKRELFITLNFPTYREGLNALYAAGEGLKK